MLRGFSINTFMIKQQISEILNEEQLEEGTAFKKLAAMAAAIGYMLVPTPTHDEGDIDTSATSVAASAELNRNRTRPPTHRDLGSFRREFGNDWPKQSD
jgi:hypothetical protein